MCLADFVSFGWRRESGPGRRGHRRLSQKGKLLGLAGYLMLGVASCKRGRVSSARMLRRNMSTSIRRSCSDPTAASRCRSSRWPPWQQRREVYRVARGRSESRNQGSSKECGERLDGFWWSGKSQVPSRPEKAKWWKENASKRLEESLLLGSRILGLEKKKMDNESWKLEL